jgi:hypothetical protein
MGNDPTEDRDELVRRIDELTNTVEALQARLAATPSESEPRSAPTTGSRRDVLRLAGTAAAGALAGTVLASSQPAAATNDSPLLVGNITQATRHTQIQYGTLAGNPGPLLSSEALMFWIDNRQTPNTVGHGIRGDGKGFDGVGVWGNSDSNGVGVLGSGRLGLLGTGGRAALRLVGSNAAPSTRSDAHLQGEIDIDSNGDVWLCVVAGTPGSWRKIGGPSSAGSFHAINPVRAYDSRWTGGTRINSGENRLVSVASGHDLTTGAVNAADVVPARSTAVAYNVTITGTQASGFLSVAPGIAISVTASSINWSGDGQNLANGAIVAVDPSRQVRVFAGGGGSTDFIIDITGYFL